MCSLLDYLSHAKAYKNQWKAQQLKMGLWLCNPYGRVAWYILLSSTLYTWELVAKFRRPHQSCCNIYYRDTPSMGRGPNDSSQENKVAFRDCKWFDEAIAEETVDLKDPDFWFGLLSHINRTMCPDVIDKFKTFANQFNFAQFTPVPVYKKKGHKKEPTYEIGVE